MDSSEALGVTSHEKERPLNIRSRIVSAFSYFSRLYLEKDEMTRSRKNILIFNISSNITINLVGTNFIVGLYTILGVSDFWLSALAAIVPVCNSLQIFSPLFLRGLRRKRSVLAVMRIFFHLFSIVLIGLIPFLHNSADAYKIILLVAFTTVSNFINAIFTPAVGALQIRSIPVKLRMDHFSIVTFANMFITSIFVLLGGKITDIFKANGSLLLGLTAVRLIALAFAVWEIYADFHVHEYEEPNGGKTKNDIFRYFSKKFIISLLLVGGWTFVLNFPSLFYSSYMIKDLQAPFSFLSLVSFLQLPCVVVSAPVWNLILKKISWYKSAACSMLIYAASYYIACFVDRSNYLWLYTLSCVLCYLCVSNILTVVANMPFLNLPEEGRIACLGFFGTFQGIVGAAGVAAGGLFISLTKNITVNFLGGAYQNKQVLMFVAGIGFTLLSAMFFALRKQE